jgi:glycosyltransferase involved in cell wall biosynthesis
MGVSVAFDMLSDYLTEIGASFREVNMTQPGAARSAGRFRLGRTIFTLTKVVEAWFKMLFVSQVYLIVSTSVFGFAKDFLIIVAAWILRKKIVVHLHGGGYRMFYEARSPLGKSIIRWTLSRTNRIIVLGELLRSQFEFLNKPELIAVVPNGLSQPAGESVPAIAKEAPADNEPWRILYLSNLMETKGYHVLLDACQSLVESQVPFQVDFCGGFFESSAESGGSARADELKKDFLNRVNAPPLNQFAKYHGTVSGAEKKDLLQQAHVLVLPTWYPWEGQPLSIIEAMSCGTLVISTRHAGIPEQIVDGETGWMLASDSIDAPHLVDLLTKLMALPPDRYRTMSEHAITMYNDCFTRQRHLSNLLLAINEAT